MQAGMNCYGLASLMLFLSTSTVYAENDRADGTGQLTPGQNSEPLPDIIIPKSMLRAPNILKELDTELDSQPPERIVRSDIPARPDRPERPAVFDRPPQLSRPVPPDRPQRPDTPGRPNK